MTHINPTEAILNASREDFPNKDVVAMTSQAYDNVVKAGLSLGTASLIGQREQRGWCDPTIIMPTKHALSVAHFMQEAQQNIPSEITVPDVDTRRLRARMTLEEALETVEALGFRVVFNDVEIKDQGKAIQLVVNPDVTPTVGDIVKECLDCHVIATGTLLSMGVFLTDDLQTEVDLNNLCKFRTDKDGHRREDGKWVKPSDHPKARIDLVIKQNREAYEEMFNPVVANDE